MKYVSVADLKEALFHHAPVQDLQLINFIIDHLPYIEIKEEKLEEEGEA